MLWTYATRLILHTHFPRLSEALVYHNWPTENEWPHPTGFTIQGLTANSCFRHHVNLTYCIGGFIRTR